MTNNPDEIRANIERTRGDLGRDVDALADTIEQLPQSDDPAGKLAELHAGLDDLNEKWDQRADLLAGLE